ncbi:MAG TPA: YceI family protein [Chitinophagaceae bacterium]
MWQYRIKIIAGSFLIPAILVCTGFKQAGPIYQTVNGIVSFRSEAPLELIRASSDQLFGIIDIDKKIFSFKIMMRSFQGFNSPLQREHFNENYMESDKYAEASFKGKIIEDQDLTVNGTYELRAKGTLTIHGVSQERIIKSDVTVSDKKITLKSNFSVLLSDHNIPIPKVVYQKLANEIKVEINTTLEPR